MQTLHTVIVTPGDSACAAMQRSRILVKVLMTGESVRAQAKGLALHHGTLCKSSQMTRSKSTPARHAGHTVESVCDRDIAAFGSQLQIWLL